MKAKASVKSPNLNERLIASRSASYFQSASSASAALRWSVALP